MSDFKNFKDEYKAKNLEALKDEMVVGKVYESYIDKNLKYKVIDVNGEKVTIAAMNKLGETAETRRFTRELLAKLLFNKGI